MVYKQTVELSYFFIHTGDTYKYGVAGHTFPNDFDHWTCISCLDPEGGGRAGGPDHPLKNHKNRGFPSNTGPDPLKNGSYQARIQCWAIIDTPAKRHLMAFRWRADHVPLIVALGSSLPSSTKKKKKKKNAIIVGSL